MIQKKSRALRAMKTKRQGEQRDKVFQALAKRNPMVLVRFAG